MLEGVRERALWASQRSLLGRISESKLEVGWECGDASREEQ